MEKAQKDLAAVQDILKAAGYYTGKVDGIPGPRSKAAFDQVCELALAEYHLTQDTVGNGTIKGSIGDFIVSVEGPDLVVRNVKCTCFGGSGDSMDSGETASGYSTKGHPDLMAVSLPMHYEGKHKPTREALYGSPIPALPFGLHANGTPDHDGAWVEIKFGNGKKFLVPCIDRGPDIRRFPKNAIDATLALAKQADPRATANNFEAIVDYRIVNGARFLKKLT